MSKLIIFAFFVLLASADRLDKPDRITNVETNGVTKCGRDLQTSFDTHSVTIISQRSCLNDTLGLSSVIEFKIKTDGRPQIMVSLFQQLKDQEGDSPMSSFRIFFERVIEYYEVNNISGYQPGPNATDDQPSNVEFLIHKTWNPIQESIVQSGTAKVYTFTVNSTDGEIQFSFQFTTDFVQINNATQLVPNSGKFSFLVNNHTYVDPKAAGLAFRVFVVSGGGSEDSRDVHTGFNTTNQGQVAINDSGFNSNFFTWNQFVETLNGTLIVYNKTLPLDTDKAVGLNDLGLEGDNLHILTLWFSVLRDGHNTTSILWDPYFGVQDAAVTVPTTSPASSLVAPLLLAFLSIVLLVQKN